MNKGSTLASLLGLLLAAAGAVAEPVPLAAVNTEWIEQDPWLSPDGYTMYFSSNRSGGDFNIFEAQWDGRAWSAPVRLSGLINSDFDETQPSVSGDGQWLLFISHRGRFWRGPWRAKRQRDGSWGKAVFVDPVIQNATYRAVIGPDGQTVCFQSRARQRAGKPPKLDLCMTYDSGTGFWTEPRPHNGEPPGNEVPGARWRFSTRNGDIYYEPTGASDPHRSDALEVFNALRASSRYGRGDEDYWMSEAQNLIDGLDDTSWISKAGEPLDRQWVLLALNGPSRYIPGLSRIHSLRIHTGPVEPITIEEGKGTDRVVPDPAHRGTCPARVRILGGMNLDAMKELAAVKLTSHAGSPWCEVRLNEPSYLRYLEVQVVEAADPGAAYVALNEVQAYGAGLSVPRPVHHVTTDENNNITIDGKPFFPIYIYNAKADPDLAKWGFNTALQTYDVHADMARLRILDQAADMGFMVIGHVPWVETDSGRKMARNQLLAMKQHPALLGYLMSDEAGHSEQIMQRDERRAAYIRKYDGNHFSMLNDLYPQNYHRSSRFVDVFSIDPYPHIVGQPYSYQAHAVDKAYECVRRAKPVFVVNASWGRIISPVENRLNVYLALIHGAKGISWYAMGVRWQDLDHWASILRCVREIHRLKPVVFAPQTRPDSPLLTHSRIENPGARIDVMIKQVNGEVWMLAANCEPRLAKVRFSFGWGEEITIREVMADHPQGWSMDRLDHALMDGWPLPKDREPVRAARPIELTFDPHAVRVFRMRPTGKIGAYHEPPGEGTPLAMVNESTLERTVRKVKQLRQEDKQAAHDGSLVRSNAIE